jgi:hypothetical protein
VQALLALLPDFLVNRHSEINEYAETHIRVKALGTVQHEIISRVTTLKWSSALLIH